MFKIYKLRANHILDFAADFAKCDYKLERYLDFSCAISALRVVDELPRLDF